MTTANKITVVRILMIPAFVTMAIYYGESIKRGEPLEWQRFTAIIIFWSPPSATVSMATSRADYNQRSALRRNSRSDCRQGPAPQRHHHA